MTADFFVAPSCLETAPRPVHMHGILAVQGGAARVMRLLADGIGTYGFSVQISCEFRDSADPSLWETAPADLAAGLPPRCLCHVHGSRNWPDLLQSFCKADRRLNVITLHDCSLLTGGCAYPHDCPGWLSGCLASCPQGHAQAARGQNELREILTRQKPLLISPSVWLRKMARAALPELKCELIPNGVEDPLLTTDRARARAAFGLAAGARMLLFAAHGGTLAVTKGGQDFLAVWQKIKTQIPGAMAFVVGGTELSRQEDVYYWPYVDTAQMHGFMLAADVFVNASRAENHSLLILEAMAAKTPVCAYQVGGIPEQVTHGETGLLSPLGDSAALASTVLTLLGNPSLARDMGVKGRTRYERHFRTERMVEAYARLYSGLSA